MVDLDTIQEANRTLGEKLSKEIFDDPNHPYRGKFVGLANGQVVAVTDSADETIEKLELIEPDQERCFCFEGGLDYGEEETLWSPF